MFKRLLSWLRKRLSRKPKKPQVILYFPNLGEGQYVEIRTAVIGGMVTEFNPPIKLKAGESVCLEQSKACTGS